MNVEQTAYTQYLKRELRKERKRADVYQQVITILSVACITLVCMLALFTGPL